MMNNQDFICLSSDEDEPEIKKRKITAISVDNTKTPSSKGQKTQSTTNSIICLDSDEETDIDSQEVVFVSDKENVEANKNLSPPSCTVKPKETKVTETSIENNGTTVEIMKCDSSNENLGEKVEVKTSDKGEKLENGDLSKEKKADTVVDEVSPTVTGAENSNDLLSDVEDLPSEAILFLSTCRSQLEGTKSAQHIFKKFPALIKLFRGLASQFSRSEYLKNFLAKQIKIAGESERGSIVSFKDVYQHFKSSLECQGVELSKKHREHVKKLEAIMNKLLEKLNEINETEVDFDGDEEDSPYIKHERYSKRLCQVYEKYCSYLKKNPYAGRITHDRLDFVSSNYNEINLAICKKYKKNTVFPNYDELSKYIQKVVVDKNLPLNEVEIKVESEHCFKKLGDLLQMRRKKELYETHCSYIVNTEDPADKDKDLDTKLRINFKEGKIKIEQVCEEFVKKQELGASDEEIDCSDTSEEEEEEEGEVVDT